MKVDRILETAVYAQDLEAAEAFYTTVLALDVHSRLAGRHIFFRCGSSMFLVFNPKQTESENPSMFPHGCHGAGHVAWAVLEKDLPAWRQWLQTKGVVIEGEVIWPKGGQSIYFRDPAGNSLELATCGVWGITS
jgi:catechol 2,3-dioxygenase-like lactoylglutathione lyase family enzyme